MKQTGNLLAACFTLVCSLVILLPSLYNKSSLNVHTKTVCLNAQSAMKMVKVFTTMISLFSDEVAQSKK
jgi:ABC-type maltose transport system permease subunit